MNTPRFLLVLTASVWLAVAAVAAPAVPPVIGIDNAQQQSGERLPVTSAKGLAKAIEVQERHTAELMSRPGIHGTAVGVKQDGTPVVKVFADPSASVAGISDELEGIPVVVERMAPVFAMNVDCTGRGLENCDVLAAADPNYNPMSWHTRPVPIGISAGHVDVTAGTLGCRVSSGCHKYALSNAHVFADENAGVAGDHVLQPGPIDGGLDPADQIGTLYDSVPIVMGTSTSVKNKVDAAIIATDESKVAMVTRADGYGQPRTTTVSPQVGLNVQKYGRTTGLTHGYIYAINAIINIGYSNNNVARFINQIIIKSTNSSVPFSIIGDSGSLIVIDGGTNSRKPVGLLFASSSDNVYTIANPINEVLAAFDITIDGD